MVAGPEEGIHKLVDSMKGRINVCFRWREMRMYAS